MEESKKELKEITLKYEKSVADQLKLQDWLKKAINQNIGLFEVHGKKLIYDAKSLYLFSYENKFRNHVVWLTEWKWFDQLVIFLIVIGSFCQAVQSSYTGEEYEPHIMQMKYILEQFINVTSYFFIFEATMKIIA